MPIEIPQRVPCPFCENVAGTRHCARLHETELTLAFVNPRQYERGAALVIPKGHRETILDLAEEEAADIMRCVVVVARAVTATLAPLGINVFQNNGIVAGQSVPHVHVHVVPRHGDVPSERIFTSHDAPSASIEERDSIAAVIRAALRQ